MPGPAAACPPPLADGLLLAQAALRLSRQCRQQGRTSEAVAHARAARALLEEARQRRSDPTG